MSTTIPPRRRLLRHWIPALLLLVGASLPVVPTAVDAPAQAEASAQANRAREVLLDPDHAAWSVRAPERFRIRFRTGEGEFVLEVHRPWAPIGADRLYNLVRLGFYDDTRVYRMREGYIAQFGLSGDPAINEVWYERTMPDDPRRRSNVRGTVAYAMLESPDTRTTQLYVNLDDNARLDAGGFAPVGRVVEGMEVVDRFYAGYGEEAGGGMRGGEQGEIVRGGNAHLDEEYPRLTRILDADVEPGRFLRFPDVGANRIRAEKHLLPAVSTGPMDPDWSPDGERIVVSMRGDLWVVDAAGGEAVALTRGPAYHFEPAWSPDGEWIAFTRELDGDLDVGVVPAAGGEAVMLTADRIVDAQPAWGPEGRRLYFASAREGSFDLYRVAFDPEATDRDGSSPGLELETMVAGPGHQIQPAVSPDGGRLAFVSPVEGRLGTGGIWLLSVDEGRWRPATETARSAAEAALERASLVHYEETAYRTEPAWTPDGGAIVFVSDDAGTEDLAVVPAAGGTRARLTWEDGDELDPAVSPGGERIAFVTNRAGPTELVVAPPGGARGEGWTVPTVGPLRPAEPTGELRVRVVDAGTGEPVPARIQVVAADERGYAPAGGFHRVSPATEAHYFHAEGGAELLLPAGPARITAVRGPEFRPAYAIADVTAGERSTLTLSLERLADPAADGWISGDTHAHDLHQGRFGLSHESFFRQLLAEDLRVTHALIHMDGTRLMGRLGDLTGEPHPLSTATHRLQYGQEFRGSFGHVGLLGISEFVMPLIGGTGATAFAPDVLNAPYLRAARAQGGIGGYMHPYARPVERPEDAAYSEIALDVALRLGDFYDVANAPYDDLVNAAMYHRFLNAGFRLPATGGTDNFADVWRDAPPGSSRTYARVDGGDDPGRSVDVPAWLGAVEAGRTFATSGPLLFLTVVAGDGSAGIEVDGDDAAESGGSGTDALGTGAVGPGEVVRVGADGPTTFRVRIEAASAAPLDRVEILVNGVAERVVDVRDRGSTFTLERRVEVPGSAWIAAQAVGPAARTVTDGYPFAHTSPVHVVRDGRRYADPEAARFLAEVVRAQWRRVRTRDRFADAAARQRYRAAVEEAIRIYEEIAAGR